MAKKERIAERAEALLAPITEAHGVTIYDVEYVKESEGQVLRAYIDKKPDGVTIDDCEAVSRAFSDALDAEDFIPDAYTLEVSSPGLDRPLRSTRDFLRQKGRTLRLGLSEAIGGRKALSGKLLDANDDAVTLEVARGKTTETISVPRSAILHAKVETVF